MTTEMPYLAHFARDPHDIITTDVSKIGLGKILWRKRDKTIGAIAISSRYLNDAEKRYSKGELELLAEEWG